MKTASELYSLKRIAITSAVIFVVAFGVRLLSWHDTRTEVGKVQTVVAADYQHVARLLSEGGVRGFFSSSGPLADPNMLGHPPGYPILIAVLWSIFGESNASIQLVQLACDALAAVLILLIAIELFPFSVGVIAALLVAFAPQFSWNSVLLLPDTLAVFPLILAVYFLTRAFKNPQLITVMVAGACIGVSCWLRANALFMGPFLAVSILLLFNKKRRLQFAGAFLAAALLIIAPLTIRNWLVFQHFIPVSLGAGQTMLEGISDYDPERRFGISDTDMGIMKMEAEQHNRPDYYSTLFAPDGIKRERMRIARAVDVIRHNPGWFLRVMVQRAASMLRLERARLVSPGPPVTNQVTTLNEAQRIWVATPGEFASSTTKHPGTELENSPDGHTLRIVSHTEKYGSQLESAPIAVKRNHDHVGKLSLEVDEGRMTLNIVGTQTNTIYSSAIVEKEEVKDGNPVPTRSVELPFVSGSDETVHLLFKNAAPESGRSIVRLGVVELFEVGPASFLWTRYPRRIINGIQGLFITAVILPLALAGVVILIRRRAMKTLVLLLSVPVYYLCFQSLLHTEYRYVLAVHYFLFVPAGVVIYEVWGLVFGLVRSRRQVHRSV
jgi:hypothetical protein